MKVAILSMQRVCNYGSFLQAYSLKRIIEKMGHQVEFLDIIPGRKLNIHQDAKNLRKGNTILWLVSKLDRNVIKRVKHLFHSYLFRNKFITQWHPLLGLDDNLRFETDADVVVIGSDEVFNFAQKSNWGFTTQLYGEKISAKKIFSYAASFGFSSFSDAQKARIVKELKKALGKLTAISVRDRNSFDFIIKLLGKLPLIHIDPTLVYELEAEIPKIEVPYNYLLLYSYGGRTNLPKEIKEIRGFARKRGLKVISVGTYHYWCDKNIIVNPFETLAYFKNAAYIVTDTFHGTVFSIITHKQFCTIVRDSNMEKLSFLLEQFELNNRRLEYIVDLENLLEVKIDYNSVNKIILEERNKALQYLTEHLI